MQTIFIVSYFHSMIYLAILFIFLLYLKQYTVQLAMYQWQFTISHYEHVKSGIMSLSNSLFQNFDHACGVMWGKQRCRANRRHTRISERSRNVRQALTCPCYVLCNKSDRSGSCHQWTSNECLVNTQWCWLISVSSHRALNKVYTSIQPCRSRALRNKMTYCLDSILLSLVVLYLEICTVGHYVNT